MFRTSIVFVFTLLLFSCAPNSNAPEKNEEPNPHPVNELNLPESPFLVVLGNVQDAGSPHIACKRPCCKELFLNPDFRRQVVSLGIGDPQTGEKWIFEATPDFSKQCKSLKNLLPKNDNEIPDGVFLTHAHIGHYSGLMYLGKEAMNARNARVYAMPRMADFLSTNGPWSQLADQNNISIHQLKENQSIELNDSFSVTPMIVPHRDEFSETVGYKISGPNKTVLFIPDIDKWAKWDKSIIEEISKVDLAFIDATFYDGAEINHRDISEIPHPFIIESMALFQSISPSEKEKIHFIHMNHTNPALVEDSPQSQKILAAGFNIARYGMILDL